MGTRERWATCIGPQMPVETRPFSGAAHHLQTCPRLNPENRDCGGTVFRRFLKILVAHLRTRIEGGPEKLYILTIQMDARMVSLVLQADDRSFGHRRRLCWRQVARSLCKRIEIQNGGHPSIS